MPSATPATIAGPSTADHALAIGRSYVGALIAGQESYATGYLTSGLANETFLANGRIGQMDVQKNPDGSFAVSAVVTTASGDYLVTMRVVSTPIGMQITEHSATKS